MSNKNSVWATLPGFIVLIVIAFIGYSLLKDHSVHLLQWLPFLVILLCPLMHFFMHRDHSHSAHDADSKTDSDSDYEKGYADELSDKNTSSPSDQKPNE